MRVLVTGGAGYIGSHVCKHLAERGNDVAVFDNLSSGHEHAVKSGSLIKGDIRYRDDLQRAFRETRPDAVMHFAAKIDVAEGERDPAAFRETNVSGVGLLLEEMRAAGCERLVFSSSCAVYSESEQLPLAETAQLCPGSVYGQTKLDGERAIAAAARSGRLAYAILRYFNAAGASPDGDIGEEHDPETHLIPNALRAAAGIGGKMRIYGNDYSTRDGTCVRDFVHVTDLAEAHCAAVNRLARGEDSFACNLGAGKGVTVLEVLEAVQRVTGRPVPHEIVGRRPGDAPALYADVSYSRELLDCVPSRSDLDTIIADAWRFHRARWSI